jgi:type III restriction enzyme
MLFERQKYQEDCVKNIVSVLKDYNFQTNSKDELEANLRNFYTDNITIPSKEYSNKLNLDILMETGTGKTFTYLKTIYELHKEYKLNKFVIFVPRKAIREGVIQNIKLTSDFFEQEYKKRLVKYTYDNEKSLSAIKTHYLGNGDELSVLVLTNSSIDKEKNILRTPKENLFGSKSIFEALKKLKPIIIIDEPHLLKGEEFTKIFSEFNSLHLRFGATFPLEEEHKLKNMVYSLDSISAFRDYLVKKIRVNTITNTNNSLKVKSVDKACVRLLYFKNNEEHEAILHEREDIGSKTELNAFNGVQILKATKKEVFLSNGTKLDVDTSYSLSDEEIRQMIAQTIDIHFKKEEENFDKGIKTLSLFFIKNVDDYRNDGRVKQIFEEEYRKKRIEVLKTRKNRSYKEYLEKDIDKNGDLRVNEGYFSGDGKNSDEKIANGVDLILEDKETLLSFDSSLRFIFSVWALQEGWDNPNIFNICKLSNTDKEISRRQQVGRGLRICVNQDGKRLTHGYFQEKENEFYRYNTLDVIVSGYEKDFINEIQNEIRGSSFIFAGEFIAHKYLNERGFNAKEAFKILDILEENSILEFRADDDSYFIKKPIGDFIRENENLFLFMKDDKKLENLKNIFIDNKTVLIENGNKKEEKVKIRGEKLVEFQELWESINKKANIVYRDIDEENLINEIGDKFNDEVISRVEVTQEVKEYNAKEDKIDFRAIKVLEQRDFFKDKNYQDYIFDFTKSEKLPLAFVLRVFERLKKESISNNPKEAKRLLAEIIKEQIHKNIIQKIEYNFSGEIEITSLQNSDKTYRQEIKASELGRFIDKDEIAPKNFLFDKIVYDSNIEIDIIKNDPTSIDSAEITVFAKLPKISIPTPYKTYNPDFAYLIKNSKNKKTLFLIVETKGYNKEADIPEDERKKIEYAKKFFEKLKQELPPDVDLSFKTRINKTNLTDLLSSFKDER